MKKSLHLLSASALAINTFMAQVVPVAAQAPGTNSPFPATWTLPYASIQRSYALGFSGLVAAAGATDIAQICGSASVSQVKVTRIKIGGRATAATSADIQIIKRSASNSGGTISASSPFTGTAVTGFNYDTGDSAGTALVALYTANPTTGTLVGVIDAAVLNLGVTTTALGAAATEFNWTNRASKAPTLRGAAQCLSVNLFGSTYAGNSLDISIEWTEE